MNHLIMYCEPCRLEHNLYTSPDRIGRVKCSICGKENIVAHRNSLSSSKIKAIAKEVTKKNARIRDEKA
jgi:hypothetical protein